MFLPASRSARASRTRSAQVVIKGNARVLPLPPGARPRVASAFNGAREGVLAALDAPLERGREPGHYVCRVRPPPQPEDARIFRANAAVLACGIFCLGLAGRRR